MILWQEALKNKASFPGYSFERRNDNLVKVWAHGSEENISCIEKMKATLRIFPRTCLTNSQTLSWDTVDREIDAIAQMLTGGCSFILKQGYLFQFLHLPPLRNLAEGGIGEAGVLVAGEAELDEPLAVEVLRHRLQNLYPPQVILDQVVVGREYRHNFALTSNIGCRDS